MRKKLLQEAKAKSNDSDSSDSSDSSDGSDESSNSSSEASSSSSSGSSDSEEEKVDKKKKRKKTVSSDSEEEKVDKKKKRKKTVSKKKLSSATTVNENLQCYNPETGLPRRFRLANFNFISNEDMIDKYYKIADFEKLNTCDET